VDSEEGTSEKNSVWGSVGKEEKTAGDRGCLTEATTHDKRGLTGALEEKRG